jgi:hypothetical protein
LINVSVETDIRKAMEFLNLLPKEADRAAYRAINKIGDEIKKDSAKEIGLATGIAVPEVLERMYMRPAFAQRLIAVVGALPSAKNVGLYKGANPRPKPALSGQAAGGVALRAWGKGNFYDKTFVMGKQGSVGVSRKVWRRVGPGKGNITSKVWGPSIRSTFMWPRIQKRQIEIIRNRWPKWFQHYLRQEIGKLRGFDALTGVKNVAPFITGAVVTND